MNELVELDRDHLDSFSTSPQLERENINRARQAAEALFRPKRPVSTPAARSVSPPTDEVPRKPRILRAIEVQPDRFVGAPQSEEREPAGARQQIPASHLARIQVWMEYGMTVRQVAQVYGVKARDINRILETS